MFKNRYKIFIILITGVIGILFIQKALSLAQLGDIAGGVSIIIGLLFLGTKIVFPDVFWSLHHKILKNIKLGDYIIINNTKLANPEGFIVNIGFRTIDIKNQMGIISLPFSHLSGRVTVTPYNLRLDFSHCINIDEKDFFLLKINKIVSGNKIKIFLRIEGFSIWVETNFNNRFEIQDEIIELIKSHKDKNINKIIT